MRREAGSVTALALMALAAHGEATPGPSAAAPSDPPRSVGGAGEDGTASRWWTFDEQAFMNRLGLDASAGLFELGRWRTIVDLRANGNRQETRSSEYPTEEFYSYLTDQGITVRNDGWFLLDPRLVTGSASVRFGWQQARQDAREASTSQGGDVTDYYLNLMLLSEKPYNAMLQAAHSEVTTSRSGGGTTFSAHTLQGATLYWREASILREKEVAPYFSAQLFGGQEDLEETTSNAGQVFHRDEGRKNVRLYAHNGFETGDLTMNFEQTELTNRQYDAGSFTSRTADITYGVDFGKALTRHSDTHVNYSERSGEFGTETFDLQQLLSFEHTPFLSSSLAYLYQDVASDDAESTVQRIDASLQYMPYLNVTTNAGASGSRVEYDTGTIDSAGGTAGVTYSHRLPKGGTLSLGANGGLTYTDSQLASSLVPVVDAPYQAPPVLGAGAGFLLRESFVDATTIVVVDVRGGSRLPTAEGLDYLVEQEGNRTKIIPLASSAVIQGGDPLEVSYRYLVDPSLKSRIADQSYFLSTDWDWIGITLTYDISQQDPLSGQQSTLLSDQTRTSLQVDMRHDWGNWRVRGDLRAARYRDEHLNYDELRANQNLSWRPSYDWQLDFDASQSESRFVDDDRVSRYFDFRIGGSWHSEHGWWTDGYVTLRADRDSQSTSETITEAYLRVRRNWPQLSLSAAVGVGQRDREPVKTTYENVLINVTRTF